MIIKHVGNKDGGRERGARANDAASSSSLDKSRGNGVRVNKEDGDLPMRRRVSSNNEYLRLA